MSKSTLNFNILDEFTPQKPKATPHIVLFADNHGKVLGDALPIISPELERATALIKASGFKGEAGECVSDFGLNGGGTLSVIGTGTQNKLPNQLQKLAKTTFNTIKNSKNAVVIWGDVICQKHFGQFVLAMLHTKYRFDTHKSKKTDKPVLNTITFVVNKDDRADYEHALFMANATAIGQNLARDVANEAPNIMTPSQLAKVAQKLGKDHKDVVNVNVLGEKEMSKLGMGCFLAVSAGSDNEGKLAVIEYYGKSDKKKGKLNNPIALVGKGITFDTGGISLKPAQGMEEMKYDMGGAAAMLGTIKAVCEAKLPIDIVVVLACAENMPSGTATRPSDIVTAMNGMSVEILNTDAEGRLVLCDALCYVQDTYKPSTIIDAATLTGACVIALGSVRSGLYTNDEDTLFALEDAGEYTNDLVWQMPLDDAYDDQLKSTFADVQNIGGREGGSITAACFLKRFIKEGQAWAHLDIAGTAWVSGGENKGATGRPVPMLVRYLANQA